VTSSFSVFNLRARRAVAPLTDPPEIELAYWYLTQLRASPQPPPRSQSAITKKIRHNRRSLFTKSVLRNTIKKSLFRTFSVEAIVAVFIRGAFSIPIYLFDIRALTKPADITRRFPIRRLPSVRRPTLKFENWKARQLSRPYCYRPTVRGIKVRT
jgi:hypothetical protein